MVQVLRYIPSPLEQLTPYINQATQSVAEGVGQWQTNRSDERVISAMNDASLSPMERLGLFLKLSRPKQEALTDYGKADRQREQFNYQTDREKRLKNAAILGAYDKRIAQLNDDIKGTYNREERNRLNAEKQNLIKEQALNRTLLRGGKPPQFKHLEMQSEEPTQVSQQSAPQRQKWNPNDKAHLARRDAVLKQVGGNREEAQRILAEEFE